MTITYTYDSLYRLKAADYSTGDFYHYTYDAVGNRLTQDKTVGGQHSTITYVYDAANRLQSVNGVTYTWDNNGNLLNDGVNSYGYDGANRLITMNGGPPAFSYVYRCNGLSRDQWGITGCQSDRVSQTVNGIATNYVLDQAAGLTQVLADGTSTYIYGANRLAQVKAGNAEYFLTDALGSVRQLSDANGTVTLAESFDPYGDKLSSMGNGSTSYAFAGEIADQTGLIYLRARYYSGGTGSFLSKDMWQGTSTRPLSLNGWIYVEDNPVNHTDPSGQCYIDAGNMRQWRIWEYPIVGPCQDHSGTISPDKPHWHEYWATNLVCSDWLGCSQEEVVDALSRFTFPGQNPYKPIQPDEESFVAPFGWFQGSGIKLGGMPVEYLGAIHSIISSGGLSVRNESEPTHIFHKGQVDRQAIQVGRAWYVVTHGTGNDIYFLMDVVNQETGAGIFTDVDRLMRQYLEAAHIMNWIRGVTCY